MDKGERRKKLNRTKWKRAKGKRKPRKAKRECFVKAREEEKYPAMRKSDSQLL